MEKSFAPTRYREVVLTARPTTISFGRSSEARTLAERLTR